MELVNFHDFVNDIFSKNFNNKYVNYLKYLIKENENDIIKVLYHFKDTLIVQSKSEVLIMENAIPRVVKDNKIIKISIINEDTRDIFDYMTQYIENDGILKRYLYNFPPNKNQGFLLQEMTECSCVFKNYDFIDELNIIDGIKQIIKQLIKYADLNLYYLDLKGINIAMLNNKWYFIDFESFNITIPEDFEEYCTYPYAPKKEITDKITCEIKKLWFYYIYALIAIIFDIILKKNRNHDLLFKLPKTYDFHNRILYYLKYNSESNKKFSLPFKDLNIKNVESLLKLIKSFINILFMLLDETLEIKNIEHFLSSTLTLEPDLSLY